MTELTVVLIENHEVAILRFPDIGTDDIAGLAITRS